MLAKLRPLRQNGASCGLASSGLAPSVFANFWSRTDLDAGGEGLEQLERHLFRRVIGGIVGTGLEIGFDEGRALLPALNDLLGHARRHWRRRLRRSCSGSAIAACFLERRRRRRHRGDIRAPAGPAAPRSCRRGVVCSVTLSSCLASASRIWRRAEALGVGPIEDALVAMLLRDRAEADWLDLAPGLDRGGERLLRILQRRGGRLPHSAPTDCFSASRALRELRVAWADVLLQRRLGDRRVIRFGMGC